MGDLVWERARQAYAIESDAIAKAFHYIDRERFLGAVELLAAAPRIAASGCGHTGIACRHFAHLMCCIERPARFIPPSEASHGASGFIHAGDAMLLASRGGKTAELLPILNICRQRNVDVIAVTEDESSPLAQGARIVLRLHVTRETDAYNTQGTTSFVTLCALFDALQAALIERTGFQNEQFAHIHPGGAVGERLRNCK